MASSPENTSMALFCDFENVALGVRDANYDKFDIGRVLERLLLKGSIVVKKAYCDWDRYKSFKAVMHEANFELIEIPHVRQSGKNSADIRLVVDALDLCYTKSHVDTFVIISGDSDFSPLVSKLRENAKQVIGVGVKQSTSDLLIANCDEFIFYDDLVADSRRSAKRDSREASAAPKRSPEEEKRRRDEAEARRGEAIRIAVETFDALLDERGDGGKIWASMLKQAIKRRKPDFNENHYGFRAFGNLLDEAQERGLFEVGRDEKSGAYVYRGKTPKAVADEPVTIESALLDGAIDRDGAAAAPAPVLGAERSSGRRSERGRNGGRQGAVRSAGSETAAEAPAGAVAAANERPQLPAAELGAAAADSAAAPQAVQRAEAAASESAAVSTSVQAPAAAEEATGGESEAAAAKAAPRRRSPRSKTTSAKVAEAAAAAEVSAAAETSAAAASAAPTAAEAEPAAARVAAQTSTPAAQDAAAQDVAQAADPAAKPAPRRAPRKPRPAPPAQS